MMRMLKRAVFIDKDGTLIPDIPFNVDPDLITIDEESMAGLQLLKQAGFLLVLVSNQSGVAKGLFEEAALEKVWDRIAAILCSHGLAMDGFYYCPHEPNGSIKEYAVACDCRKPMPGLLIRAAADLGVDLSRSWMIGDILNDVEAGKRAGCSTVLIDNGNETEWIMNAMRQPDHVVKNLREAARCICRQVLNTVFYE